MKNIVAFAMKEYGHYYNHDTDTLTVTKNFLKNSEQMDTPECKTIVALYALHPNMKIVTFTTEKKKNVAIPYDLMIQYICLNDNKEERIKDLQEMKNIQLQSHSRKSPYKFVRDWFTKKYPNYGKVIKLDANGELTFIIEGTEEGKSKQVNATTAAPTATTDNNTTVLFEKPKAS